MSIKATKDRCTSILKWKNEDLSALGRFICWWRNQKYSTFVEFIIYCYCQW